MRLLAGTLGTERKIDGVDWTYNNAVTINQNLDIRVSSLLLLSVNQALSMFPVLESHSYPHRLAISIALGDHLQGYRELLLQIPSAPARIVQIQLCVLEFLGQTGILQAESALYPLKIYKEILETRRSQYGLPPSERSQLGKMDTGSTAWYSTFINSSLVSR